MCGLAGILTLEQGSSAPLKSLELMAQSMRARGPDGSGLFQRGALGLAHRRLRIIDLSDRGAQPMVDPALGLELSFNGCIYNYNELRRELQGLGYAFFSDSDSEVILKGYHAWGIHCVERFNGMFAFAIHERDSGRLVLARDRLGIKPLYLSVDRKRIAFASTLPALLTLGDIDTTIDTAALNFYLNFHAVVPAPRTLLKGIRKLPPGTVRTFERTGTSRDYAYWDAPVHGHSEPGISEQAWREGLLEVLRRAVRRRTVADVPVGVLLSGGVDSSLITALLAEQGLDDLHTFSIGFEAVRGESGDEFEFSDLIAGRFGTRHHRLRIPTRDMIRSLPATIAAMSEPMVSHDNVGFYLLSQEVAKHIKVVQSGQGADEVFGGYHWYPPLLDSQDGAADYAAAFCDRSRADYESLVTAGMLDRDYAREYIREQFGSGSGATPVEQALHLDTHVMLVEDPVKRVDNMTMAAGLEARVPFLDHELVEFAGTIPATLKVGGGGKYLLKEVARELLPREVIDRPKGYFPVPELKYIRGPVLDFVREALSSDRARQRGLFRPEAIDRLLAAPEEQVTPLGGSSLWQVALLELWLQTHDL